MNFIKSSHNLLINKYTIFPRLRSLSTNSLSHLVRPITIRTCVNLYPRLHHLNPRLYPLKAPTDGIKLTVNYLDTSLESTAKPKPTHEKVILAVPGAAGSYRNFEHIISHFRSVEGVRVVAPNLPDFSHTRASGGLYWHSTTESVTFLRDFLREINLQKVDCVLGHSMAMHSILALCEQTSLLETNSIILFSPHPQYDMDPDKARRTETLLFTFRSELWYNLLSAIRLHKWSWLHSYRFPDINSFLLFWMPSLDREASLELPRRIYTIRNQTKIKVALVYGSKEKLVSKKSIQRLFGEFGINETEVIVLDQSLRGQLSSKMVGKEQAFVIQNGGHFAYAQFPAITNQIIEYVMSL